MPDRPKISLGLHHTPCYVPALDEVRIPDLKCFFNSDAFYSAYFHELVHSTGAKHRLNRFEPDQFSSETSYSKEELVAELGAAYLSTIAGIEHNINNSAAYVKSWLKVLEGNIYEGHTLIPILQHFEAKFSLSKPVVIADAGLLSKANLEELQNHGYKYILGARIKNENMSVREQILSMQLSNKEHAEIKKDNGQRLIIQYSDKRAKQDEYNRQRGLKRLESKLKSGRLTKSHINNRGYNKYLVMKGKINIEIDYDKFTRDQQWDGLKGYITNSRLGPQRIIDNYRHLFHIERAFRISKSDLRIRPVFHRLQDRIDAHLCIAFSAYAVYKELERVLAKDKSNISATRAGKLAQNMYELEVVLPDKSEPKNILLQMTPEQAELMNTVIKHF